MLRELQIKNLAIIDQLHVEFNDGLNILSGETGAGKSIIIDAVHLILGGRANADLIRNGAEEASVEALFDLSRRPDLLQLLAGRGIDCDGDLIVRRTVSRSGKNRVFMAGSLATTSLLGEVSRSLINIYGQHESQTLLKTERHLQLLDGFAGSVDLRHSFGSLFDRYQKARQEIEALEQGEREAARRCDLLSFQIDEIAAANLKEGEEEELAEERKRLAFREKLLSASQQAFDTLYGGDSALLGRLRRVIGAVTEASAIDATLSPVTGSLEEAYAQLEDASLTLRDYAADVEADPGRLEQLDDRIDAINRLKRKYGESIREILRYHAEISVELARLQGREQALEELEAEVQKAREELSALGKTLTSTRSEGAARLKAGMERELAELAMTHAVFETLLESTEEPRTHGFEKAEFLFSPNPGEPPKPLAKIASGGELSRVMLALKQLHPESDVPTLIFDEVDTGIGGATSALVGRKLKRVAKAQQVLAITHLPQVAAFADLHLRVEKTVREGRTVTAVTPLEGEGRVSEMARMLAGSRVTAKTLEHAREMIEEAAQP